MRELAILSLFLGGCVVEEVDPRVPIEVELLGAIVLEEPTSDCIPWETYEREECCEVWYPYIVSSQEELETLLEPWEPQGRIPELEGFDEHTVLVLHRPWCINQDKNERTTFYVEDGVLIVDIELVQVGVLDMNSGVVGFYGIPLEYVFDSVEVEFR